MRTTKYCPIINKNCIENECVFYIESCVILNIPQNLLKIVERLRNYQKN
jgi:hypothetical protein